MFSIYNTSEIPPILTVKQLAEFLGIGQSQAYALVRSDQIDVIRIGKSIRIPRHCVLSYLGCCSSELM